MQKPNEAGREHYMKREQIAKNIVADLKELAALTSDIDGAQRIAWTPTFKKATEVFAKKMQAAGAEVWTDAAGNSWAKFAGESEECIVIGSHLDSVPDGGWLDGALGVVAGMGIGAYGLADKKPAKIKCQIADRKIKSIKAEILSGDIHDKNDFENGDNVKIEEFTDFRQLKDGFTATLPACSVVKFIIE